MNQKAYHRSKVSIDSTTCTKFKLIFLATIVFFFIATVSFAQEGRQKISFDCTKEKSIHKTILPNTKSVEINTSPCYCSPIEAKAVALKRELESIGRADGYRDFEHFWKTNTQMLFSESYLPASAGESKDYTYQCWTKEQLKVYYDELIKFSGKPKN